MTPCEICGKPCPVHAGRGRPRKICAEPECAAERHRRTNAASTARAVARGEAPWRKPGRPAEQARRLGKAWQARYAARLIEQNGLCAICARPFHPDGLAPADDHDNACCPGKGRRCGACTRGLLCRACNLLLGHARDDCALLAAACEYLRSYAAS